MELSEREMLPRDEAGIPILTEWMEMNAEHLLATDQEAVRRMLDEGTLEQHLISVDRLCQERLWELVSDESPTNIYRAWGLTAQMAQEDPARYYRLMDTAYQTARDMVAREIALAPLA